MQRASLQESLGKLPDDAALAFTAAVGGNPDIYLLTNDKVQQLTVGEARDEFPSWAPDGRQIAFHSKRDGNFDIYVMDSDGGNVRRLTLDKGFDGYPAWSPDGKVIAFQSSRGTPGSDTPLETYLMNADGTNVRKLVPRTSAVPPSARMASWSPDGSRVVVEASAPFILNDKRELVRNAKDGLYTVSVNGADSHQLSS
jgi:TolB protein